MWDRGSVSMCGVILCVCVGSRECVLEGDVTFFVLAGVLEEREREKS